MESLCLGILAGSLGALLLPSIPDWYWPLSLFLLCIALRRYLLAGIFLYLSSLSLQLLWHSTTSQQVLAQHSTIVAGTVVSIPQHYDGGSRFILQLSETVKDKPQAGAGSLVLVRWYQVPVLLQEGQQWQLPVKIRKVRGLANPGSGWTEASALVSGVVAQAIVQNDSSFMQLGRQITLSEKPGLDAAVVRQSTAAPTEIQYLGAESSFRQQLINKLELVLGDLPGKPLMLALTVGERPFSDSLWLGLQATGLGHLISISGMHIALVFGWVLLCQRGWALFAPSWVWRFSLTLGTALLAAGIYSAMAGFAVPTVRALLALILVVLLRLLWRRCSGRQFSLLVAAGLLLWQPFWLLSLSFWLSLSAVALVFYLGWRYPVVTGSATSFRGMLWPFLRYQLIFSLLMLPLGLVFFQGIAPLALLSNLMFVPWCTLLVIPLLLLVFLLQSVSPWPLTLAWQAVDYVLQPLMWWLEYCANASWWWTLPEPELWVFILLLSAMLLLLLPKSRQTLLLAVLLCVPFVWPLTAKQQPQLHLIDVGQGTALLLQDGEHGFLYDFGPRYGAYSATEAQVIPYLRYQGIKKLDYLLLSHDDSDHSGHLALLKAAYPNAQLVSDVTTVATGVKPALNCRQLPMQWQRFSIQTLWPPGPAAAEIGNNQSCVLALRVNGWSILFTGDINSAVESKLLDLYPQLRADLLLLAHHGSQSSNKLAFLQQLQPKMALNSAGFGNHYQHPSPQTRARLSLLQIPLYNTGDLGALRLSLSEQALRLQAVRPLRKVKWLENLSTDAETAATTR